MPEIKHNFTGGKMNKDVDERLVPNGEYRDAMNIQVSTSEGSDVGTIQNILGNNLGCTYPDANNNPNPIITRSTTVGSVSDEKNDSLYWLVAGPVPSQSTYIPLLPDVPGGTTYTSVSLKDMIMHHDVASSSCQPVFVDKYGFITHNDFLNNSTNSIVLNDTSLYSNITTGMTVTGYDNSGTYTFGPTLVIGVGNLWTIPLYYQSGSNPPTSTQSSNVGFSGGIYVRTFNNKGCIPTNVTNEYSDLTPCTDPLPWGAQQNLPPVGDFQFWIPVADWDPSINIGSTLSGVNNSATGLPMIIGGATEITDIQLGQVCNNQQPGTGSGCQQVILLTLSNVPSPGIQNLTEDPTYGSTATPDPFPGDAHSYADFDAIITPAPINTYTPNNTINILPTSYGWLNEVYDALNSNPPDTLAMNPNANWPPNGCIDPTSVTSPTDSSFNIVDCGDMITPVFPFSFNNHPISFDLITSPIDAVFLNENINTITTDTLVFNSERVLNFDPNQLITGINILDDMLLWTDNFTEPKKINIPRSIAGTDSDGNTHTKLVNNALNINPNGTIVPIREEHITVIKKSPKNALTVDLLTDRDTDLNYSGIMQIDNGAFGGVGPSSIIKPLSAYDFSTFTVGDVFRTVIESDMDVNLSFSVNWKEGTKVVLKEFYENGDPPQIPIYEYRIKGVIDTWNLNNFDSANGPVKVSIKITSIEGFPPDASQSSTGIRNYSVDLFDESEKIFEFKFPRFSYRYKYEDGEYSTFAPFTEVAFLPGNFNYHPKKGYNLGMTNRISSIKLENFRQQDMPKDVVEIDLLYKEDVNPNIYIVDTIKPKATIEYGATSNKWDSNTYEITSETIHSVVAENQLLRPWDNVPRKALAQEVTGNRIVYGNYLQNYNLTIAGNDFYPDFKHNIISEAVDNTVTSIKSLRDYQLGVVFIDKYGRETPVISNPTATFKIEKAAANTQNELYAGFHGGTGGTGIPIDFKYYKFFIKEISGEYYNMAMDRFYDAEDDNIWISFPSADRNKIDIDTFLILKKGVESNDLIVDTARYKVIAIENEAPDFIKTKQSIIYSRDHINGTGTQFNDLFTATIPAENNRTFIMNYNDGVFDNSGINKLHEDMGNGIIYFQLQDSSGVTSQRYRINTIGLDAGANNWNITIDKNFKADINKFTNNSQGGGTEILDNIKVVFYRDTVENSPEFDGRFFVKIYNDVAFKNYIINPTSAASTTTEEYIPILSKKIYNFNLNRHRWVWNNPPANNNNIPSWAVNSAGDNSVQWDHYAYWTDKQGASYGQTPPWSGASGIVDGALWKPYDAFFRGINIAKGDGSGEQHKISKRESGGLEIDVNTDNFGFQDVWFVDDDTCQGYFSYGFEDPYGWNSYPNTSNTTPSGINGNTIELSFGGIQPPLPSSGLNAFPWNTTGGGDNYPHYDNKVFDLLNNANYIQEETEFIESIEKNYKIWWKEDPTNTVYTIETTEGFFKVRYEEKMQELTDQKLAALGSNGGDNYDSNMSSTQYATSTYYRPSNFTRNWKLTLDKPMGGPGVWNPHTTGPIPSGLEIPLEADATYAASANQIKVVKLNGIDTGTYGLQNVQVGMVLHKIASTQLNISQLAIISAIDESTNTLKLKKYYGGATSGIDLETIAITSGDILLFAQYGFNGLSPNSAKNINYFGNGKGFNDAVSGVDAVGYTLQILESTIKESIMPTNPAIWETEPKENVDLDIYYEISGNNPIMLDSSTIKTVFPIGSKVTCINGGGSVDLAILNNNSPFGDEIVLNESLCVDVGGCLDPTTQVLTDPIVIGDYFNVTRLDGTSLTVEVSQIVPILPPQLPGTTFKISTFIYNSWYTLNWHNCYAFGNGVESNRVRDNFNLPFILNGVKASTTVDSIYKQEHRKYGLIYSGIYNSNSGVNNLNQFIQAEKITKDINPIYGSIQKLHSQSTAEGDLITLCEDRVLKILANKDALYNADGNVQLTSTDNVLGKAVPYSGNFGISENPESFASESYRVYFTDKVRGAIIRLSKDGLTPISDHGMKDWFRDNLKLTNKLIGSYDDKKDEYNITLDNTVDDPLRGQTVSFREDVKGWVSFKSFMPENGISCVNEYFTFDGGILWKHHIQQFGASGKEINRNTFYNQFTNSNFNVLLNELPGSIKTFSTLNYEGSQSKITPITSLAGNIGEYDTFLAGTSTVNNSFFSDDYYNLNPKDGWYVAHVQTDKEEGSLDEFIEKEGKWFNHIKGKTGSTTNADGTIVSGFNNADSSFQGIGRMAAPPTVGPPSGCTDPTAFNYDPAATTDDGTCTPIVLGCIDAGAFNYNSAANTGDGSCVYPGCICSGTFVWAFNNVTYNNNINCNPQANQNDGSCIPTVPGCTDSSTFVVSGITYFNFYNYNQAANVDDGSCIATVLGCTDANATNYNAAANVNDGSCISVQLGCTDPTAFNYNSAANTDDGSCLYLGCTDPAAVNYNPMATVDDGSCSFTGCTDATACNYNPNATADDGSCILPDGCTDSTALNYDPTAVCDDGSCIPYIFGCTDATAPNYNPSANTDDGSCIYYGCTNPAAQNYDPNATVDDGSCIILGCTDASACNYDPLATNDDGSCILPDGCTNPTACNYNPAALCDDGSCLTDYGCTDPLACNYDPLATCDDNSCEYTSCIGCTDPGACNFNSTAVTDDGSCEFLTCVGCTDPTFIEYCGDCWDYTNQVVVTSGGGVWPISCANCCEVPVLAGCTDDGTDPNFPNRPPGFVGPAFNYDVNANVEDGSCAYIPVTYVPDNTFETYLEFYYNSPYGMYPQPNFANDYVYTGNIDTITQLELNMPGACCTQNNNISDLTGIEDFAALSNLWIMGLDVTDINLSSNTSLSTIDIQECNSLTSFTASGLPQSFAVTLLMSGYGNTNSVLTTVDVSNSPNLTDLYMSSHQFLQNINVSTNINLVSLNLYNNDITGSLDLSNNTALTTLNCADNQITSLDVRNGNNQNMTIGATSNNITVVYVDNIAGANALVTSGAWVFDSGVTFSL